jgi:histidinol-phosphate/aromatic aminotransferase/cobyric acid decarboxylase-like protein
MDFARKHSGKTVLVDESFLAFHTGELCGSGSLIRWLEREPLDNVHVVCSLSKTLGIPGARLGYIYSRNAEFLRELGADLPIWNLNSFAEFVMEVALKHRDGIGESLRTTAHDRGAFREQLLALDEVDSVWPGGGNFLLVRFRWSAGRARSEAERLLSEHSIYVKDVSARFNDGGAWWRLAVRLPEENILFCERIRQS